MPAKKSPAKKSKPAASLPGKAPSLDPLLAAKQLAKVREICAPFANATERLSHGAPSFYVDDKKAFMYFCDNHHHDGRLALWCAAPEGAQAMLVDSNPDHYFLPPYVTHLGWVGVRLDRDAAWSEIAAVIENAYLTRAPKPRARKRS